MLELVEDMMLWTNCQREQEHCKARGRYRSINQLPEPSV